ncbi:MAG: hypothetical protein RL077_6110 [Verrucomicrobiota bacterium]|jgi:hypothetical protein
MRAVLKSPADFQRREAGQARVNLGRGQKVPLIPSVSCTPVVSTWETLA